MKVHRILKCQKIVYYIHDDVLLLFLSNDFNIIGFFLLQLKREVADLFLSFHHFPTAQFRDRSSFIRYGGGGLVGFGGGCMHKKGFRWGAIPEKKF